MLADRLKIEIPADMQIMLNVDGGCSIEEVTEDNPLRFELDQEVASCDPAWCHISGCEGRLDPQDTECPDCGASR